MFMRTDICQVHKNVSNHDQTVYFPGVGATLSCTLTNIVSSSLTAGLVLFRDIRIFYLTLILRFKKCGKMNGCLLHFTQNMAQRMLMISTNK